MRTADHLLHRCLPPAALLGTSIRHGCHDPSGKGSHTISIGDCLCFCVPSEIEKYARLRCYFNLLIGWMKTAVRTKHAKKKNRAFKICTNPTVAFLMEYSRGKEQFLPKNYERVHKNNFDSWMMWLWMGRKKKAPRASPAVFLFSFSRWETLNCLRKTTTITPSLSAPHPSLARTPHNTQGA